MSGTRCFTADRAAEAWDLGATEVCMQGGIDPELPALRFAWTNKGYVGWAMADLKALRSAGYPDPQLNNAGASAQA